MTPVPIRPTDPPLRDPRGNYQPQLDGLRGIAILSVLIHHFDVHLGWFDWGPIGVRLFFLLSGYLITLSVWKLIKNADGPKRLWGSVGDFHFKRAIRLMPVLYIMLGIGVLMGLDEIREGILWHAIFLTNFYTLANDEWPGAASHLWSISVQEQFYILWPFLLLVVPPKRLPWVLFGLVVFAFGFRTYCRWTDASVFMRWLMLPGVIDSFALGALVACWKTSGRPFSIHAGNARWVWTVAAISAYTVARALRHAPGSPHWFAIIETLENFALAWILLRTMEGWRGVVGRVLSHPWLVYIGKISFGLYIFHVLVHVALGPWLSHFGILDSYSRGVVLILVTLVIAALSWRSVEGPLAAWVRRKKRLQSAEGVRVAAGDPKLLINRPNVDGQ